MTRPVAIVASSQLPAVRCAADKDEVGLVQPVVRDVLAQVGLSIQDVGFICAGSCDYLLGRAFTFVSAMDALGAWPPVCESHVEMDGAWALYEAWVRLQCGDVDTALVYAFGKSSQGDQAEIFTQQLDPYVLAPLGVTPVELAALQARALIEAGRCSEEEMARIAYRCRTDAAGNPNAQVRKSPTPSELFSRPYHVSPLREHDGPPLSDGAAAIVLATGEAARRLASRPAWILGMDHRMEPHSPGARDLTRSKSTETAGRNAGVFNHVVDVAELYAPFTHQELILREALHLEEGVRINPSGGALAAHVPMVAGLTRFAEAAGTIARGEARRAVAHATSGPVLQQNLVALLGDAVP